MPLLDNEGNWTTSRDHSNMLRDGDEDGIERRALTIESIGIVRVREGPWFVYDKSAGGAVNMMRFRVMHWGNLLSGARRAWERDPQKKNRAVQLSVSMGISRCRRYDENAPDDANFFDKRRQHHE